MPTPTKYSRETFISICECISEGAKVRNACESNDIHFSQLFRWLANKDHEDYEWMRELYARAKEYQAEAMEEELFEIADDAHNDTYVDDEGNERTNHEVIARSKLRIDTRKWAMARRQPRIYGDKLNLANSEGGDFWDKLGGQLGDRGSLTEEDNHSDE